MDLRDEFNDLERDDDYGLDDDEPQDFNDRDHRSRITEDVVIEVKKFEIDVTQRSGTANNKRNPAIQQPQR